MLTSPSLIRLFATMLALALVPSAALAQAPATGGEPTEGEEEQTAEVADEAAPTSDGAALGTPTVVETAESEPEEAAPAEEEAAPAPQPPIYRGSLFSWQHGMTVNTLNPDAQLTYNPTYYWSFFLQPRLYLDGQNFLVLSIGLSVEMTDADYTTTQREPQLSDTVLEWRHTEAWEGFVFVSSVRLAAPTSMNSIAADRVLNTGLGLTVVRVIPEALNMTIALSGSYRHWWAASNVATTTGSSSPFHCNTTQGAADCDQVSGLSTEQDRLVGALTLTIAPLEGLSITTQYAMLASLGHGLGTVTNPALGGPPTIADGSATHWRNFQYWTLAVAYDVVPWLNLSLGYQSASSVTALYNDDGSVRNPFYSPDSELYLVATLAIDGLVEELEGEEEGDGLTPEERQRRRQGLSFGPRRGASF